MHGSTINPMGDEQVGGLQIAVHDAEGVRFGDRLARLEQELDCVRHGHGAAATHPRGEIFTLVGTP